MPFVFRGHLCGILCGQLEIIEDLEDGVIRLYRPDDEQNVSRRVAAAPKDTVALLKEDQIAAKENRLLAEATTDADGNFRVIINENETDYDGEAFEVDVYLERTPNQKEGREDPVPLQVQVTTIQPQWRQRENDFVAIFDYCFSERIWCAIRERLGAWVIIGRLTVCPAENTEDRALGGFSVSAFDNDWLEDDPLGSATTNANGIFRIDYLEEDFKQTFLSPLVNVETLGSSGPDIYFHVRDNNGNLVLEEPSSRGSQSDRDDSPACFCVELCVPLEESPPFDFPYFTRYGHINLVSDLGSDGKVNKTVTNGGKVRGRAGYAFFGNVFLQGFIPKTHPVSGKPMRYRFIYAEAPSTPNIPLTNNLIEPTQVAERLITWNLPSVGVTLVQQNVIADPDPGMTSPPGIPAVPSSPMPLPDHIILVDPNGWIEVDPNAIDDGFNGELLTFKTGQVVSGGAPPTVDAGDPVTSPQNGTLLNLRMEASATDGTGLIQSPIYPMYVNNWREAGELSLAELATNKCAELSGTINIQYTVDHELLETWSLGISTVASGFSAPTLPGASNPPSGATSRGANGTQSVSTSSWPTCVYTIRLTGRRMLTNGDEIDDSDNLDSPIHVYIKN